MDASVISVSRDERHRFTKPAVDEIELVAGLGIVGDAHYGATVQHLHRIRKDPTAPNLRQVHLMHAELFDQVAEDGFAVSPGELGENLTTRGLDLLWLPTDALLHLGDRAVVRITGLRNPCTQINGIESGLMKRLIHRAADGSLVRLAGVMAVVEVGGVVRPGDGIRVELPEGAHEPLQPV